jgi:hypothetical protein
MDKFEPSSPGPLPNGIQDPDTEWAEYVAWLDREIAAGRDGETPVDGGPPLWESDLWDPEVWEPEVWESDLWDPEVWEPEDSEPADPARPLFGQDGAADVLPPGPLLAGLTEQAVGDLGRLSDNELIGVLQATRRQIAREQYKQVLVTAEFGRRR